MLNKKRSGNSKKNVKIMQAWKEEGERTEVATKKTIFRVSNQSRKITNRMSVNNIF
uniref:Uncharacterized protein n=1 Tax=Meloidogyne enterolobii TaxID=390850 RepID=A0A6V7WB16_MELEN|nr:unnamed protein product [Meloidogyne enterolobii]